MLNAHLLQAALFAKPVLMLQELLPDSFLHALAEEDSLKMEEISFAQPAPQDVMLVQTQLINVLNAE